MHPDIIRSFIYPSECTTRLKFALKFFYIKMLLHISLTNHHQATYCHAWLKLIKIVG